MDRIWYLILHITEVGLAANQQHLKIRAIYIDHMTDHGLIMVRGKIRISELRHIQIIQISRQ